MARSIGKVNKSPSVKEDTTPKKENVKKRFEPTDLITCVSITPGELFMIGEKSDQVYSWADINDEVEVEYQDLNYAARRGSSLIFKPRFIIQDEDFVALFPKLNDLYAGLYETSDLKEIMNMSVQQINSIVPTLPVGAYDALQTLVMTEIDRGAYSDIKRIKAFDALFETNMLSRALNANS